MLTCSSAVGVECNRGILALDTMAFEPLEVHSTHNLRSTRHTLEVHSTRILRGKRLTLEVHSTHNSRSTRRTLEVHSIHNSRGTRPTLEVHSIQTWHLPHGPAEGQTGEATIGVRGVIVIIRRLSSLPSFLYPRICGLSLPHCQLWAMVMLFSTRAFVNSWHASRLWWDYVTLLHPWPL